MNLNHISQRYLEIFPGDFSGNPAQRQTPNVLFATVETAGFPNAELIRYNEELGEEIGLGRTLDDDAKAFLNADVGNLALKTYATAYAGHQFGNWAGQLGDGRAIFAGDIINDAGKATELQWKGAGATPYSRHADGRAVLRSTVREYLMSEAMHHLGVPTTRALSLSLSGEAVVRDIMYSGDARPEKGALMMRAAESFLRFGHFELAFALENHDLLRQLADFCIENYFPEIISEGKQKYLDWFRQISMRTADLMVEWYRVGFVHGVMNTDNMSILGLTIDYGPFGMLEGYDLAFTPNTTDLPGRRYAFGEQAKIAQWNLWQLANALFPLINDAGTLQEILDGYGDYFWQKHDEMLCRKFGFDKLLPEDTAFFSEWQEVMAKFELDYTLFFIKIEECEEFSKEDSKEVSYRQLSDNDLSELNLFLKKYRRRLSLNEISREQSIALMRRANPRFILRNYLLFEAAAALESGDGAPFDRLLMALKNPYDAHFPDLIARRPSRYDAVPGCSMLSCSS